jgi:hypothetical protein
MFLELTADTQRDVGPVASDATDTTNHEYEGAVA